MLKTNSKKVKETIKNYIMDSFHDSDFETWRGIHVEDYSQICSIILSMFWQEKIKHDKRNISEKDFFVDWCQGLPSILGCEYYYNISAVDLLGEWLEETEEEKSRFSESEAEIMIANLLYRELKNNGSYLPRITKADFLKGCGDYRTYKDCGRSKSFASRDLGYEPSTILLFEDAHFTII